MKYKDYEEKSLEREEAKTELEVLQRKMKSLKRDYEELENKNKQLEKELFEAQNEKKEYEKKYTNYIKGQKTKEQMAKKVWTNGWYGEDEVKK